MREFKWECALLAPEASVAGHEYDAESTLENCASFLQVDQEHACSLVPFLNTSFFGNIEEFIPIYGFLCFRYCNWFHLYLNTFSRIKVT